MNEKIEQKGKKIVIEPKQTAKTAVVYIGPAIKDVVMSNTVFSNGISKELELFCKELPILTTLIVPINRLAIVREGLQDKQSAISICYQKVVEHLEKKGE